MGVRSDNTSNPLEGINLEHELDDYISNWVFDLDLAGTSVSTRPTSHYEPSYYDLNDSSFFPNEEPNTFFDEAFYPHLPDLQNPHVADDSKPAFEHQYQVPDSFLDPQLRAPDTHGSIAAPDPPKPSIAESKAIFPPGRPALTSLPCWFGRKLVRKSKRDESTYDHSPEAGHSLLDHRLYHHVKQESLPFKCSSPTVTAQEQLFGPVPAAPGLVGDFPLDDQPVEDDFVPANISQEYLDDFLSSLNLDFFDANMSDILDETARLNTPREYTSQPISQVINKDEFTRRMLAPSAPLIQPSEKRKRGRPKKGEVEESHQEALTQTKYTAPLYKPVQTLTPVRRFVQEQSLEEFKPYVASVPVITSHDRESSRPTPDTSVGDYDEEGPRTKRRRITTSGGNRTMSKKEQAYLEMDQKVKLYDESNIHELLFFPTLRPGRVPCFWIQRHPYANTKVYKNHYKTWCRYRHCKGVETHELIRTATGELREKNYKHPRTVIAGNYQVAVDWEYVDDEIGTFKNDIEGQYEYDRRSVFDTIECFFHLRCFEMLTNFPQVVRQHMVKVDHRVLNKDKSRNKITKRKNKGGTNAAEIEWYLKDDAEQWMRRVRADWGYSPLPGTNESLEKTLLNGKKSYNDRKVVSSTGPVQSPTESLCPD
ncbi:hypothetical protein DRE_03551 [Drechslerella stenobrocha 248]|uniref:Uncharacterized protein n=1 Tax=Drechslerella stenobrocha 248 TaxID=1043628 RepID=W7I427_9PEZI|nr:hypothetical protein DRE_03551 [Drechslerella stenobrocha 248]